ncbi:hypothetical protein GCM10007938_07640 [Vibrio zhanjiangensis]|uniref:Uncharacterized protein n=1 Tax=Vibrio zhanjiangensis TaxID=1046128 RepID=A0ABQ6EUX7_9VIBR|nr:hypothetical protein GCM10007938_07640 [Vibrio zhanjiangensis]
MMITSRTFVIQAPPESPNIANMGASAKGKSSTNWQYFYAPNVNSNIDREYRPIFLVLTTKIACYF